MSAPPELEAALHRRGGMLRGRELHFLCLAHDDHRPSARYNLDKQVWYCDVCHASGGWVDLCCRLENRLFLPTWPLYLDDCR